MEFWTYVFVGLTTTQDSAVVAALYLDARKRNEEREEMLYGCTLSADGIRFRQSAVLENFALPMPALKTRDRVVLSFTVGDKVLQLRIGSDPPVEIAYDDSPPVINYPVVITTIPGNLCQMPRVDPCLCDSS